jgi:hypothetical protein
LKLVSSLLLVACAAHAVEIPASADAHVSSLAPQLNAGTSPTLNLNSTSRVYLRFPLNGQLPAGTVSAQIASAWLHLWPNRVDGAGGFQVLLTDSAWDEATITLANAPALPNNIAGNGGVFRPKQMVRADVTGIVRQALANGASDLNLGLVATPGLAAYFDSKENTATSHMPVIEIEVSGASLTGPKGATGLPGPQGAQGTQGSDGFQLATGPFPGTVTCSDRGDCSGIKTCVNQELVGGACEFATRLKLAFSGPVNLSSSNPGWKCVWTGSFIIGLDPPAIDVVCAAK